MAMNGSRSETDIGRDLLLKSGSTWIDAISGVLGSLHLEVSRWFAFDRGEEITLRQGNDGDCIRLAARQWGLFVRLGNDFYVSHLEGGVINALGIIAKASPSEWHRLPDRLNLEQIDLWEFQRLGDSHRQRALFQDGWEQMDDDQYFDLTRRYNLTFHSFESVPINLDAVLPNCEYVRGSIRSTQNLFTSDRSLFWHYENHARRSFADALMHCRNQDSTVLCFCVNHGSYVLRTPIGRLNLLADATWPCHLTDPGGRVLLFVPELQEAMVTDETQGSLVGYGREISTQFKSLFAENPSVWGRQ
ncbi:MAG: hypothetical protein JSS49_17855 [Planctomycetes bacterium]|nr:hypothetical protein [Planctomycetota bacterium]